MALKRYVKTYFVNKPKIRLTNGRSLDCGPK
jgi:hypothetical protein